MELKLQSLRLTRDRRVGLITLTRADAMNTIGAQFIADMETALAAIEADPDIGTVVITGSKEVFVAGGDIREMLQVETPLQARPLVRRINALFNRIEALEQPVIAAMAGLALGGGCELALACDIRYGAQNLRIGLPEITLGVLPGSGGTQRLPRLVGPGRAKELLLSGQAIDAEEAARIGLVNKVVATETCLEASLKLGHQLSQRAPVALGMIKALVNTGMNTDLASALELEQRSFELLFGTRDKAEGMGAFVEKRAPIFTGQ